MRFTCLKCGHQIELAVGGSEMRVSCVCGRDYTYPNVVNTGTQPNERAAERSRYRAFRAAGIVQNFGGFALGIALLGVIFFPFGIVGAGIGVYVLTMLRGPVGRYSGRPQAMAGVAIGVIAFLAGGGWWLHFYEQKQLRKLVSHQEGAREDMKRLLRAERLFKATNDRFGGFSDFKFQPSAGQYSIYLGPSDVFRGAEDLAAELPSDLSPGFSEDRFLAVAVANLDDDSDLDVWTLTDSEGVQHLRDDLDGAGLAVTQPTVPAPSEPTPEAASGASGAAPEPTGGSAAAATPEPAPAPEPTPTPAPAPKAEAAPAPAPAPAVEKAAAPEAAPEAVPAPTPTPEPGIPAPEPE